MKIKNTKNRKATWLLSLMVLLLSTGVSWSQCPTFNVSLTHPNGLTTDCNGNGVTLKVVNTISYPSGCTPTGTVFADVIIEKQGQSTPYVDFYQTFGLEVATATTFSRSNVEPGTYRARVKFYPPSLPSQTLYSSWVTVNPPSSTSYTFSYNINYNNKTSILSPFNICGTDPINILINSNGSCLKGVFVSIQESDQWWAPVSGAPEVTEWLNTTSNPNGYSFNLRAFCQSKGYSLQQGKYYRVKVATSNPWMDYTRLIYIENSSNAQSYPYFTLENTPWFGSGSANSPAPITFTLNYALQSNLDMNGAGTTCENKYIITIEEANQFWGTTGAYGWSRLWDGYQVPNNIELQSLCEQYATTTYYNVTLCNNATGSTKRMIAGNLPPNYGGGARYYRISLATMEPGWQSITSLIRFTSNCQIMPGPKPKNTIINNHPQPEPESVWSYSDWIRMTNQTAEKQPESINLDVFPNPMYEQSTLRIRLNADANISLKIVDVSGRTVMSPFQNEFKSAGEHLVFIQSELFPASGTYFAIVQSGDNQIAKPIIVNK